jgi:hypothetical protein
MRFRVKIRVPQTGGTRYVVVDALTKEEAVRAAKDRLRVETEALARQEAAEAERERLLLNGSEGRALTAATEASAVPEIEPLTTTPKAVEASRLTACPDCGKQVSRRAAACPHCGCPLTEDSPAPGPPLPPPSVTPPLPVNEPARTQTANPIAAQSTKSYDLAESRIVPFVISGAAVLLALFAFLYKPNYNSSSGGRTGSSGSRLTADNFMKIKPGMNHQEVTLILGQPTKKEGSVEAGARIWRWEEGSKEIVVVIANDGSVMADGLSALKTQKGLD